MHGEKVAYGILVQLRLEEIAQQSSLAYTSRQQLMQFYGAIGLPQTLADMGMADIRVSDLQRAAEITCRPQSDIHHLPFSVTPEALMGALVTTTAEEMKVKKLPTVDQSVTKTRKSAARSR